MNDFTALPNSWLQLAQEKSKGYLNISQNLNSFKVDIHTATWCPDCEREVTEVIALAIALGSNAPQIEIIQNYENKEDYKSKKSQGALKITALPEMIFYNSNNQLISKLIETSSKPLIQYFQEDLS